MTPEQLEADVEMARQDGEKTSAKLWELLMSLINHSTNHRAQILALLHQRNGQTVEQGIYFYLLER